MASSPPVSPTTATAFISGGLLWAGLHSLKLHILKPKPLYMLVFEDGAFGNLGVDEAMRVGPHNGISALLAETPESSLSVCHVRTQQEADSLQASKRPSAPNLTMPTP